MEKFQHILLPLFTWLYQLRCTLFIHRQIFYQWSRTSVSSVHSKWKSCLYYSDKIREVFILQRQNVRFHCFSYKLFESRWKLIVKMPQIVVNMYLYISRTVQTYIYCQQYDTDNLLYLKHIVKLRIYVL